MPVKVYGADAFTVGADTNISTYDANWVQDSWVGSGVMQARASTDDVRVNSASPAIARWTGAILIGQSIIAKLIVTTGNIFPGLMVRAQKNANAGRTDDLARAGYLAEWDSTLNDVVLYRVLAADSTNPTFTVVAQGGAVATSATYTNCKIKATGTNPVQLAVGDDTNGAGFLTFSDSNALRWQDGDAGLSIQNDTFLACAIDDVEVWDEDAIVATGNPWRLAIQQRAG